MDLVGSQTVAVTTAQFTTGSCEQYKCIIQIVGRTNTQHKWYLSFLNKINLILLVAKSWHCPRACKNNTGPFFVTGIEPHGNKVLQPAVFTVETLEAGSGEVLVYVEDPEGHKEEASSTR